MFVWGNVVRRAIAPRRPARATTQAGSALILHAASALCRAAVICVCIGFAFPAELPAHAAPESQSDGPSAGGTAGRTGGESDSGSDGASGGHAAAPHAPRAPAAHPNRQQPDLLNTALDPVIGPSAGPVERLAAKLAIAGVALVLRAIDPSADPCAPRSHDTQSPEEKKPAETGKQNSTPTQKLNDAAACEHLLHAPRFERWSGVDAGMTSAFAYTGTVFAPFSPVTQPGWRLRFASGYGGYIYGEDPELTFLSLPNLIRIGDIDDVHVGQSAMSEAAIGYQYHHGRWVTKAYIGAEYLTQSVTPDDPANADIGTRTGIKVTWENWWTLDDGAFAKLDVSHSQAFDATSLHGRVGQNVIEGWLDVALEAQVVSDSDAAGLRAGLVGTLHLDERTLTVNGGWSGSGDGDSGFYVGLQNHRRF